MASTPQAPKALRPLPATKPHAGFIAASSVSGAIALFMLSASLREFLVAGLPASNVVLAVLSVVLFRRGLRRQPGKEAWSTRGPVNS